MQPGHQQESTGGRKGLISVGRFESSLRTETPVCQMLIPSPEAHVRPRSRSFIQLGDCGWLFESAGTGTNLNSSEFNAHLPRETAPAELSLGEEEKDLTFNSQHSGTSKVTLRSILNVMIPAETEPCPKASFEKPEPEPSPAEIVAPDWPIAPVSAVTRLDPTMRSSPTRLGEQLKSLMQSFPVWQRATIVLPARKIRLAELVVAQPVMLVGCPGCELIVVRGPVAVKARNVEFSECAFVLGGTRAKNEPAIRLFEVCNEAELRLSDCMFKSGLGDEGFDIATRKIGGRNEVCINICSETDGNKAGTVRATACSFVNFFTHIVAGENSQMQAENCGFFKSSNSGILAINPAVLCVSGSNFEDCGESALEVRWVRAAMRSTVPGTVVISISS